MELARADVLSLNERFAQAVEQRDAAAMRRLWSVRAPVLCLHVGGTLLVTSEDIHASWSAIFSQSLYIETQLLEVVGMDLDGDMAWLTTIDRVRTALPDRLVGGDVVTTKVVRLERDGPRICVHHAGQYR